MSELVFNVPARLAAHDGRRLIVRTAHPAELVESLGTGELNDVAYVQLLSLPTGIEPLIHWAEGLAIDLILTDPAAEFTQLYRFAKLIDNHPVRVSVPVKPGFTAAVKLAESLQFAVKLEVGQPDAALIQELLPLLKTYLHRPTLSQPIEYFHSLLLGLCRGEPVSLWAIQEEDPALVRYIDDEGREQLAGKLTGTDPGPDPAGFVERWCAMLLAEGAECAGCASFTPCRGYFKWPHKDYDCAGVKALFRTLREAALELERDLAAASAPRGGLVHEG